MQHIHYSPRPSFWIWFVCFLWKNPVLIHQHKMNKVETIIIVYVCIRVLSAHSLREDYYIQWKTYTFHSNTRAIGHDNSRSVVNCMMKCSVTPACVAAKFYPTNGDCELHQVYNVHTPIMILPENSSVVIVKSGKSEKSIDILSFWLNLKYQTSTIGRTSTMP